MTSRTNHLIRRPATPILVTGIAVAFLATPAHGGLCLWSGLGGDTRFDNQLNWSPDPVPGAQDRAVFDVAGTFDVTFTSHEESVDLLVLNGAVRFGSDLLGDTRGSYALTGDVFVEAASFAIHGFDLLVSNHVIVDDGAEFSVSSDADFGFGRGHTDVGNALIVGAFDEGTFTLDDSATLFSTHAFLAEWPGSIATVRIDGIGSTWINGSDTLLGDFGNGLLEIDNGGLAIFGSGLGLGNQAGSSGVAHLDGPGSGLYVWEDLGVGRNGEGDLTISNGAELTSGNADVGAQDGTGNVLVTGPGSSWYGGTDTRIGREGNGTMTIADGAIVDMAHVRIGDADGANGGVTVLGSDTRWDMYDALWVGRRGTGDLNVMNGALVTSTYGSVGREQPGVGDVTIMGPGARWEVAQSLALGGAPSAEGGSGSMAILGGGEVTVGSTLRIWSGGSILLDGGTLTATHIDHARYGSFQFLSGKLHTQLFEGNLWNDGGTIAPGRSVGQSQLDSLESLSPAWITGQTEVTGWFVQTRGVLEIDLLGQEARLNDRLVAPEAAHINGALVVRLLAGFVPDPSDEFVILESDWLVGEFTNADVSAQVEGGGRFDVIYDRTSGAAQIRLTNYAPGGVCPTDLDGDGRTDFNDLTLLFAVWGACEDCAFDFNGDGFVGMRDLEDLLDAWGNCR